MSNRIRDPLRYIRAHGWGAYFHGFRAELARRRSNALLAAIGGLTKLLPNRTIHDDYFASWPAFLDFVNQLPSPRVLEIGSRNVSGNIRRNLFPAAGEYVGFDIHAGENVDVVGDAHRLSEVLPREHFDVVFCVSVFEHLAMPWKAVLEINRVLKPGGSVFISTHPVWPPHELPWDFWRYGPESFKVLFHRGTGFELTSVAQGVPCSIIPHGNADPGVALTPGYLAVAVTARKIGDPLADLQWDVPVEAILSTKYPSPRSG